MFSALNPFFIAEAISNYFITRSVATVNKKGSRGGSHGGSREKKYISSLQGSYYLSFPVYSTHKKVAVGVATDTPNNPVFHGYIDGSPAHLKNEIYYPLHKLNGYIV